MIFRYRLPVIITVLSALAASVYASVGWLQSRQSEETLTHSTLHQALAMREISESYRLLPDSIMTGLCWRSADGSRQGIFKDINNGIMQWREAAPGTHGEVDTATSPYLAGDIPDEQELLRQLKELSFQPNGFILTEQTAKISGVLTVANRSRQIILDMVRPRPAERELADQDLIDVTSSTAISRYLPVNGVNTRQYDIDLCLNMQAAANTHTPALALDMP